MYWLMKLNLLSIGFLHAALIVAPKMLLRRRSSNAFEFFLFD